MVRFRKTAFQGTLFPASGNGAESARQRELRGDQHAVGAASSRRANAAQNAYLRALRKKTNSSSPTVPAGTGKTWLAVGWAVSLLESGQVDKLIYHPPPPWKPANASASLPGDMREKVDPYLRPIYDALYDFMEARHVERSLTTGMIEIAPLAFMRGRTLTSAVVLLDEAPKHHFHADEDVSYPSRRRLAHDHQR